MTAPQFTPEQRTALADAVYSGRKIEAIKELRQASGLGLKEAKEIIDRLESELRIKNPERFTTAAPKNGCTFTVTSSVIAFGVLLYLLLR